jgi:ATP-dependent protease ClpP protease subunit
MLIFLHGEITQEVANDVRQKLGTTNEPIELHIDSPGGDVFAGLSIYNMLQSRNVQVYVDGLAGSIASIIALVGDDRPQISETGTFAIHNALINATSGNHNELRKVANSLEKFSEIVADVYEKKTNLSRDEIKSLMDAESIFNAKESVELGFAKEIYQPLKAVAYFKTIDMNILERIRANMATTEASVTEAIEPSVQANAEDGDIVAAFDETQVAEITAIVEEVVARLMAGTEEVVAAQVGEEVAQVLNAIVSNGSAPRKTGISQPTKPINGLEAFYAAKAKITNKKIS